MFYTKNSVLYFCKKNIKFTGSTRSNPHNDNTFNIHSQMGLWSGNTLPLQRLIQIFYLNIKLLFIFPNGTCYSSTHHTNLSPSDNNLDSPYALGFKL